MYGWLWRNLPGPWWVKTLMLAAAATGVVALCFQFVFPWASPMLPFNNVTVEDDGSSTPPPTSPPVVPPTEDEELPGGDQPGDQQPTDEGTEEPPDESGDGELAGEGSG